MGRRNGNSVFGLTDVALERIRQGAVFLARGLSERKPGALVFTGTRHGDGSTSATFETARALRDAIGLKPLVVALEPPAGKTARAFTLDSSRRLEDMLDPAGTLADCVQPGPYDLPMAVWQASSNGDGVAANLHQALTRTLAQADATYDAVLVDAPPFLESSETSTACQVVPHVVLVVLAGKTRYEVLERIAADVHEQGATLVGTVLSRHRRIIPNWFYRAFLR
jgi:tyrosine-protein kinase Etk/Wzc